MQEITADLSKIPDPFHIKEHGDRIESGALIINNDWPGIFFRGDDALYFGMMLSQLLEKYKGQEKEMTNIDYLTIHALRGYVQTLMSCRV